MQARPMVTPMVIVNQRKRDMIEQVMDRKERAKGKEKVKESPITPVEAKRSRIDPHMRAKAATSKKANQAMLAATAVGGKTNQITGVQAGAREKINTAGEDGNRGIFNRS